MLLETTWCFMATVSIWLNGPFYPWVKSGFLLWKRCVISGLPWVQILVRISYNNAENIYRANKKNDLHRKLNWRWRMNWTLYTSLTAIRESMFKVCNISVGGTSQSSLCGSPADTLNCFFSSLNNSWTVFPLSVYGVSFIRESMFKVHKRFATCW